METEIKFNVFPMLHAKLENIVPTIQHNLKHQNVSNHFNFWRSDIQRGRCTVVYTPRPSAHFRVQVDFRDFVWLVSLQTNNALFPVIFFLTIEKTTSYVSLVTIFTL